jgi:membrane associated rhomboid family serine protease
MRAAASLRELPEYPVVAGTACLAIAVTIAWWCKVDLSPLFATAMIRRGEVWRLVTSIFPHLDILHLAFNVYWLWVFGSFVEKAYGHLRTLALILLFAVASSALDFAFAEGGVGLSGVGYGLFGLLWVLSRREERFRDVVDERTVLIFVGWFFFCILTTLTKTFQVANIAHGAGAVVGILTGLAISLPERRKLAVAGVIALVCFGLWGSTLGRPRINLSREAGYEEGQWGYDALVNGRDREASRWLGDAVVYQPKMAVYWYDLGIAYQKLGNKAAAKSAYQRAQQLEPKDEHYAAALQDLD